jgi:hypothetical protein
MENSENNTKDFPKAWPVLSCEEFIKMAKKEAMKEKLEKIDAGFAHFQKIFPQIERKGEGLNVHFEICGFTFYVDDIINGQMILLGGHLFDRHEVTDLKSFGEYVLWHEQRYPKKPEVKFEPPTPVSIPDFPPIQYREEGGAPWWKYWK